MDPDSKSGPKSPVTSYFHLGLVHLLHHVFVTWTKTTESVLLLGHIVFFCWFETRHFQRETWGQNITTVPMNAVQCTGMCVCVYVHAASLEDALQPVRVCQVCLPGAVGRCPCAKSLTLRGRPCLTGSPTLSSNLFHFATSKPRCVYNCTTWSIRLTIIMS